MSGSSVLCEKFEKEREKGEGDKGGHENTW